MNTTALPATVEKGVRLYTVYVRRGEQWSSTGAYCLDGITRGKVLEMGHQLGLTVREKNFTLTNVYNAEEAERAYANLYQHALVKA